MKKGYLVLENGKVFEGERFGHDGEAVGELVFNTSAVGYIETLTDPCNYGLIVMQTFPQIGNYGWINEDAGDKCIHVSAYVVREWCELPSNFRSDGNINDELVRRRVVGLCGIDTREVTRILRENGVVNACITDDPAGVDMDALKAYKVTDAVKNTVTDLDASVTGEEGGKTKVAVVDFGLAENVKAPLAERNCGVVRFPYCASADEIMKACPDAIVLSDGAGDPSENAGAIKEISGLFGKLPMLGIGLGSDILALAAGAETVKMKNGHRGGNQPVKCSENGKTYITSQNHGYAVTADSIAKLGGKVILVNGNDASVEGYVFEKEKAFGVQFVPVADCASNNTEEYVFSKFIDNVRS